VFRRDGAPSVPSELHALSHALRHRAADSEDSWIDGSIALAARLWHTTPESFRERQPHCDPAARLSIVFDGRLDNRDDLFRALGDIRSVERHSTDVELIVAAYRRWSVDCASRLIGDFAFALWDADARRLFCCRDILGVRPFYYRLDDSRFAFASEGHALVRYDGSTPEPNERMVAEYLTRIVDKEETLLDGVVRLPPAHSLTVDASRLRKWRYWDVDPDRRIEYSDDREYVEHLTELLTRSVRARLRSASRVGVMLSGGLDSSTVLGMARTLGATSDTPTAYSLSVRGPEDESEFFRAVAAHVGARSVVVTADLDARLPLEEEVDRYLDIPQYPNVLVAMPLRARAQTDGVRVMLSGLGADEWLGGSDYHYADQLRRLQLIAYVKGLRHDVRSHFLGWRQIALNSFWPMVPAPVQRRVSRLLGRQRFPLLDRRFAERVRLRERIAKPHPNPGFRTYAQYDLYRHSLNGSELHATELLERCCAPYGIENRHPFYDRRVIEFGMAVPETVRWRDGVVKYILRRVAAQFVPPVTVQRLTRPDYSRSLMSALETHAARERFRHLQIGAREWVDGRVAAELYADTAQHYRPGDPRTVGQLCTIWMVFAIELWSAAISAAAASGRDPGACRSATPCADLTA
jgi:asparagine synthase (glutamine-hydrolysing)